ncbi:Rqc2 family fibronectin-binding protein [Salisediminibacterium halotolerans]|uniref:Rqc2 homolog RqcH n=1 Tax=Salisediminibacterium halotolerans TaxID=517425 RepID=A0A1H9PX39_9BACI|nr:NFACT RNA binding domain-containing protein [Salisediminibacterium haloalkalitolerans]SER52767.1 Predicted component of the ribosome quality control (RQC) complex, YloA/Tae2 family, contains fibronectin-binding (FbpA) and DUF814 domains [Salisediminibacterium haloalkalitolerans]
MSFDGTVTRAVTHELSETIQSGRITKIHQPYPTDLTVTVRAAGKNHTLFFSVNPNFARFHLTSLKFENPKEPPMFAMVLRKHLEGSILESIEQQGLERIVTFSFKGRNELGDVSYKKLTLELMGRHSNLMLIDAENNTIIDSIKHIPPSLSQYRTVLPGKAYVDPPHQGKLNPLESDETVVRRKIDYNRGKIDKQLLQTFEGLSPQTIKEIMHRAGLVNQETLPKAFTDVIEPLAKGDFTPNIVNDGNKELFSVIALTHAAGETAVFSSMQAMLDQYYEDKAERDRVRQRAHDLERFVRNEYEKNKNKIAKLTATLADTEKAEDYQKQGELLTAHIHLISPGDTEVDVIDYYDPDQGSLTIALDPQKSGPENAQALFKKYRKLLAAAKHVKKQIREAKKEMSYLDNLLQQMEQASTKDLEDIREELEQEGYLKQRASKKKAKKKPAKPQVERYVSSSGTEVYVGKNNKQNEYLTMRLARQDDTWLHTKDIPGSHVLIRSTDYDQETLIEAAQLAAYFSKGRMSGQVPVDYTLIRHVKKPNGAKPGFVTYDQQTTLFVNPDEQLVQTMRRRAAEEKARS